MHAGLGRLEGVGEPSALGLHPSLLSSLVALPLAALLGLLFPLRPAVFHFGALAHDPSLRGTPRARGQGVQCRVDCQ